MAWLLSIEDKYGNDLYPEIRKLAAKKNAEENIKTWFVLNTLKTSVIIVRKAASITASITTSIRTDTPEYIEKFNIPLDEYPRRCVAQIEGWAKEKEAILKHSNQEDFRRSIEYASHIMEAVTENKPIQIGGNVLNTGLIDNLPRNACVEVPCLVNGAVYIPAMSALFQQLAAMNRLNINVQLLTIQAAVSKKREDIYMAAMLDPLTSSELNKDKIKAMIDEMIEAHGDYMKDYR